MKYLITGGTGLIGTKLIAELRKKDDIEIAVLTRNSDLARIKLGNDINYINKLTQESVDNQDVIINLAGEPIADKRWSAAQKEKICHSRWSITDELVKLISTAIHPPKVLISGSAIGIYGRQNNHPIDESFVHYHEEFSHRICKRWEKIALAAQSQDTRVAILRTGIVLDKYGGALAKMLPPFKLGLGGKIADGTQRMSWIHIDDMVAAIIYIIEQQSIDGVVNMTAPTPVSNLEFSKTLSKVLSRPCLFTTPQWMLKLIFGEMSDLLVYGQNVHPKKLLEHGFNFKYSYINDALNQLLMKK
ncbi:TIGR01777 family oxidoreductase [Colwelliaceae bacterium 6471]